MTHHNLTGWAMPQLADGDVIDGGNLSMWVPPTDISITVRNVIIPEGDYPSNITFESSCVFVKPQIEVEPEPVQNLQVASKAELVFRSLISSGKLPETMIPAVEQMLVMVKSKVNVTDIVLGVAATIQTQEIIDSYKQLGDAETVTQLEQALSAVQAMWRAE